MKTLFLIRHAKSSWNFDLRDHDRPLGKRGRRDVIKMGAFLEKNVKCPDKIISSTASRALNTATFLCDFWNYPEEQIMITPDLYHADTAAMIKIIATQKENTIALVGHNPGLTDLLNELADKWVSNIPTCAVVGIQFEIDKWHEITEKKGEISCSALQRKLADWLYKFLHAKGYSFSLAKI